MRFRHIHILFLIFLILLILSIPVSCGNLTSLTGNAVIFGTAVRANPLRKDETYSNFVKDYFSCVVSENALKMSNIHPRKDEYYWENMDCIVKFAEENNLLIKGHTILWHHSIPEWFYELPSCQERMNELKKHVQTVVERYKGKVKIYDVVNEPLSDEILPDLLCMDEVEIIKEIFSWVRETDPQASLSLNESGPEKSEEKREEFINLVNESLLLGAPIDLIGIQAHFKESLPPLEFLRNNIQEIHERTSLPVYITEFDISPPRDPEKPFMGFENWFYYQMIAYRIAFDLFRTLNSIDMIYMWGFSDKYHWRPGAGLLDQNMNEKPVMETVGPILISSKTGSSKYHGSNYMGLYLEGKTVKLKNSVDSHRLENWRIFYGPDVEITDNEIQLPEVDTMTSLVLKADVVDGGDYYEWYVILPDKIPAVPFEMECEDFPEKTQGNEEKGYWNIWGDGHISVFFRVEESGEYTLRLLGFGEYARGAWPKLMLVLDENMIATFALENEEPEWYELDTHMDEGVHRLTIYYLNDYYDSETGEDRNALLDKIVISE